MRYNMHIASTTQSILYNAGPVFVVCALWLIFLLSAPNCRTQQVTTGYNVSSPWLLRTETERTRGGRKVHQVSANFAPVQIPGLPEALVCPSHSGEPQPVHQCPLDELPGRGQRVSGIFWQRSKLGGFIRDHRTLCRNSILSDIYFHLWLLWISNRNVVWNFCKFPRRIGEMPEYLSKIKWSFKHFPGE